MKLKLKEDFINEDQIFGPLPNFEDTFEKFFIQKAIDCLFKSNNEDQDSQSSFESVSISDEENLNWMYDVDIAENSNNQNLEIIYNNSKVFYKTIKRIYKNDELKAFPSKDLEISLGLQFIQINSENLYTCKKCNQNFVHQYYLMLHSRYFCTHNANNLLKIVTGLNKSFLSLNGKSNEVANTNKVKRKLTNDFENASSKKRNLISNNQNNTNEQENLFANYFRKLVEYDPNSINQFKHLFSQHIPTYNQYSSYSANEMVTNFLSNLISSNSCNMNNFGNIYQNFASNYQQQISQQLAIASQNNQHRNNFSNMILTYWDMRSKLLNEDSMNSHQTSPQHSLQSEPSSPSLLNIPLTPTFQKNLSASFHQSKPNINESNQEPNSIKNHHYKPNNVRLNVESKLSDLQSIQNWCAKCNTHFRLTSDLVYHMRTFHRKEDPTFTNSKLSKTPIDVKKNNLPFLENTQQTYESKRDLSKYLRCEICNELFKEKHHLRRHLTSHR